MNRTDRFLALITFLLALITLELVSPATSHEFRTLASGTAMGVIYGMPLYLLFQLVKSRVSE